MWEQTFALGFQLTTRQKMVLECQQHPDYQTAIQTHLNLAGEYGNHDNRLA